MKLVKDKTNKEKKANFRRKAEEAIRTIIRMD